MRVRHIPKQLVLLPLAFCLSVSGCAYMIEGPTQEIRLHCRPDGNVRIMVDGQAIDFADGVIVLQKTRETHFVTVEKEGYMSSTLSFNRDIEPLWPTANLVWGPGCFIGWLVDWLTASVYRIDPKDIHVVLQERRIPDAAD